MGFPTVIFIAGAILMSAAVVLCSFPATLSLERAFPSNHLEDLSQLRARDRVRHGRKLQSSNGIVDFPVEGTYNPFRVGLYYTKLQLGSPPRDYYVQIDTGSDVLWVNCGSCNGCPETSGLPVNAHFLTVDIPIMIQLNLFDPGSSTTSQFISCSDRRCSLGVRSSDSDCSTQNNQCSYTFQYGDGSGTSGYYVSDLLHLETILEGSLTQNYSANVVFGYQGFAWTFLFHKVLMSWSEMHKLLLMDNPYDGISNCIVFLDNSSSGAARWCIGLQKIRGSGITILGDLVLKDKIVVYDLGGQRIGWTNYDCSTTVNVSATSRTGQSEYVNAGQLSDSRSLHNDRYELIPACMLAFLSLIITIQGNSFL
ncbi:hypothetical protein C1H46_001104 [Malus baccata]|uniref:Peptidase A1 domain-containing protein n=1 Tax=Malus baccata TaxID=106549 RepID=A0A540NQI7_MALBA|nr:hypothetical protein C1H46_001104 [Malus baccata]